MGKKKMQSPSSINMYLQCPRKYFFRYKLRMPTKPSIHLVRGSVAHLALEKFYSIVPEVVGDEYKKNLKTILLQLLDKCWGESKEEFDELDISKDQIEEFYIQTRMMMENHLELIFNRLDAKIKKGKTFPEAFSEITPDVEAEYISWDHYVKGFIDIVENDEGKVRLMDYKTSKKNILNDQYRLQLAIYAMLYKEKHNKLPDEVGIYFLKFKGADEEIALKADEELYQHAVFHIEQIHLSTSSDNIGEYPQQKSPLCNWCDYYDYCFKKKPIPEKPLEYKKPFKK
ncbi:MAG: RecB family exonuclease [Nanobdellota archaeon]